MSLIEAWMMETKQRTAHFTMLNSIVAFFFITEAGWMTAESY